MSAPGPDPTYVLTFTFTVFGEHDEEDLGLLAWQAGVQIEEPHDADGERATFQTSNVRATLTRSIL